MQPKRWKAKLANMGEENKDGVFFRPLLECSNKFGVEKSAPHCTAQRYYWRKERKNAINYLAWRLTKKLDNRHSYHSPTAPIPKYFTMSRCLGNGGGGISSFDQQFWNKLFFYFREPFLFLPNDQLCSKEKVAPRGAKLYWVLLRSTNCPYMS